MSRRPIYLHGLDSSPFGKKSIWLQKHFMADAPNLPACSSNILRSFESSVLVAKNAIEERKPALIIGSSFGGAVLMQLVLDRTWLGPCIFIANAGVRLGLQAKLPKGTRAILIHGENDPIIPFTDAQKIIDASDELVELWPVSGASGDHQLHSILADGTLHKAVVSLLPKSQ